VVFVGNIRPYFSPRVVISCSSFLYSGKVMTASETFLPASFCKALRFFVPLYVMFIAWASLRSSTGSSSIPHFDKILHIGVYGLLAMAISLAWPRISKIKIWAACLLYGGVLEIAQGTLSFGRTPSVGDFTANGLGALAALLLVSLLNQKFTR